MIRIQTYGLSYKGNNIWRGMLVDPKNRRITKMIRFLIHCFGALTPLITSFLILSLVLASSLLGRRSNLLLPKERLRDIHGQELRWRIPRCLHLFSTILTWEEECSSVWWKRSELVDSMSSNIVQDSCSSTNLNRNFCLQTW